MKKIAWGLSAVMLVFGGAALAMDPPGSGNPGPQPEVLACGKEVRSENELAQPLFWSVVRQSDPVHRGHLHLIDEPGDLYPFPQCGVANPAPAIVEPDRTFHYRTHTFRNFNSTPSCIVVELYYFQCGRTEPCPPEITCQGDVASGSCGGVGPHEPALYLDNFDPQNIRRNFLADGRYGAGPGISHIETTVPAYSNFVLVVRTPERGNTVGNGVWGNRVPPREKGLGYDPYYDVFVKGCGSMPAPGRPIVPLAAEDEESRTSEQQPNRDQYEQYDQNEKSAQAQQSTQLSQAPVQGGSDSVDECAVGYVGALSSRSAGFSTCIGLLLTTALMIRRRSARHRQRHGARGFVRLHRRRERSGIFQ